MNNLSLFFCLLLLTCLTLSDKKIVSHFLFVFCDDSIRFNQQVRIIIALVCCKYYVKKTIGGLLLQKLKVFENLSLLAYICITGVDINDSWAPGCGNIYFRNYQSQKSCTYQMNASAKIYFVYIEFLTRQLTTSEIVSIFFIPFSHSLVFSFFLSKILHFWVVTGMDLSEWCYDTSLEVRS